ncbi:K+-transporting ATPase, C subunit [Burkholderia ambifaria AMMD]|uniref:Potassium-transporting ATPase KdpC subunit n=1 Tax=Burkholderia ambifaria (strain ATCC BAA-244 / DSM 16087 / CCUG 44356 / LMG 19182 / AMMD) TaxID=339670 RepID=KDPC_BURCM|nr:potassium-transporting ATPase subunit KdpC [Burkholderia ambifaria]Q0BD93.1 RecName: Full=Potassium-transporting ATPase KdpC subunit; AltName: Full=ATP phosphohydrolase [potassium-transporting] C chain; AltName: Full=Potassium-binding and translocating subunit C; AltName: Full=Potassium-translocating ATPase C chain [Burkholderia ambifaria AMMD]ABI87880.1 potassium-transporting ATPase, C subunit [Burkholderia ambifaria AMMD]AJY22135.1 K+-transporting ATPase, C subunit [Burkholderia ambifaria A
MKTLIRPLVVIFVVLTAVTGLAYPAVMTVFGQAVFPSQANGSLIEKDGRAVGSALIGQPFDAPKYFWGRLSATSPMPYNASGSGGSNLGPLNPSLAEQVKARIAALRDAGTDMSTPVPVDLVTASASGLDPEITPAAAAYQVERVAKARNLSADAVAQLVAANTAGRQFGVLGEPRVNVLKLNLALDAAQAAH